MQSLKEHLDEATELLRQAVEIGESWFARDPAHEKLALWRNTLARSYTQKARRGESNSLRCQSKVDISKKKLKTLQQTATGGQTKQAEVKTCTTETSGWWRI